MGLIRKIVTYDELPDKRQLFYQGVGPPSTKLMKLEDARTKDDRLPPEFAFYAVGEDDLILGQVGVAFSKTNTIEGVMTVGGIWGVVTSPGYLRRGIATRLMERAHEFFLEHDMEIVGLGTSRSLVAHAMYQKLGYRELDAGEASRARKWNAHPRNLHNQKW